MIDMIGPHKVSVDGDVLSVTWDGDFTVEHAHKYLEMILKILEAHPAYFAIGDTTRMGRLSPDARRVLVARHKELVCGGAAVIGASFLLSTLLKMTISALSALHRNQTPMRFVKNREEAMEWFETLRKGNSQR